LYECFFRSELFPNRLWQPGNKHLKGFSSENKKKNLKSMTMNSVHTRAGKLGLDTVGFPGLDLV